jgi:hypothetical protein
LDFTEEFTAFHHHGGPLFVVMQMNEITIAKLLCPFGQMFRNDVGVHVYLQHIVYWLLVIGYQEPDHS